MKQFDSASIRERLLASLSQDPDWKAIASDSVIAALVSSVAEVNAETARYAESLFIESKWDTAINLSSITAAASQLGYKPARKRSAFGEIYISADPKIHLVGREIFKDNFLLLEEDLSYVPNWGTLSTDILLNETTVITDASGNNYTMTSTNEFTSGSAWVKCSIMQGIQKSTIAPLAVLRTISSRSKLDPFIYVPIKIEDCEDANLPFSEPFFRIFVNYPSTSQEYRVVDTLHTSDETDYDVAVFPDLYDSSLLYLKFNASPLRGVPLNLSSSSSVVSIEVQYIETTGQDGNVTKVFQPLTVTNIPGQSALTLFGMSLEPISGGADEETVTEIKHQAPLYYLNSYSVSTKEAYENAIKLIDFDNKTYADKVKIFSGTFEESDIKRTVTYCTMIAPALEDRLSGDSATITYEDIERILNFYLFRIKSPTDTIKFAPPNYTRIGVGITATADQSLIDNLYDLNASIKTDIEEAYGARSSSLDFNRPVYDSDIVDLVKEYPAIKSVKSEIEAVELLPWSSAVQMQPHPSVQLYTLRMTFDFNPLFAGKNYLKGFRDYRTGASYMLRFDIFYKKSPTSSVPAYHTSIFVKEDSSRANEAFYLINDYAATPVWDEAAAIAADYPFDDANTTELSDNYQFYLKKKIFSDDSFQELISANSLEQEPALTDYEATPGMLSSYLVWASGDSASTDAIGAGYLEFELTSMYQTLAKYAEQDQQLYDLLQLYPLANVKCDVAGDLYQGFIDDVLANYVEVYASVRPLDKDLIPEATSEDTAAVLDSAVLFIDTRDDDTTSVVTTNLSADKRARFLSVETELI